MVQPKKFSKQTKKINYLEKFKNTKEWKIVIAPKIFEYKIIGYIINNKYTNNSGRLKEISKRNLEVSLSELINDYSSYYKIIKLQPYTMNKMFIRTTFNVIILYFRVLDSRMTLFSQWF